MADWPRRPGILASRLVEAGTAAVCIALAIAGFIAVPDLVSGWRFAMPGISDGALAPTFFPRLAMVLLGVSALAMLLTAPARRDVLPIVSMTAEDWRRFGAALGLILGYVVAARLVGFLPASVVFIAAMALLSGYRNLPVIALAAVLAPLAVFLSFRYGLRVLLPPGTLW